MRLVAAIAALGLAAAPALAAETLSLAPGQASQPAVITDAEWLVGHWVGEGLGGALDEVYLPVADRSMSGTFRLVQKADGKVRFYELTTLTEQGGSLVYRIKHANPDLSTWEEKGEATEFRLVKAEPGVLWFDGMTIRRTGEDAMTVWVVIGSRTGGPTREEAFTYRRVR